MSTRHEEGGDSHGERYPGGCGEEAPENGEAGADGFVSEGCRERDGAGQKRVQLVISPTPKGRWDGRYGYIEDPLHPLALSGKADTSWDPDYRRAYRIDRAAKKWTMEIALPFSVLGTSVPAQGTRWRGNLGRERHLRVWNKKKYGGKTPAQYKASVKSLKKARKFAHTPSAEKKRAKSMALRRKAGLDEVQELTPDELYKISDALAVFSQKVMMDRFELGEEDFDTLAEILIGNFDPVIEDGHLTMTIPVWSPNDDGEFILDEYEVTEVTFSIQEGIDANSIVTGIIDDFGLADQLTVGLEDSED